MHTIKYEVGSKISLASLEMVTLVGLSHLAQRLRLNDIVLSLELSGRLDWNPSANSSLSVFYQIDALYDYAFDQIKRHSGTYSPKMDNTLKFLGT